MIDIHTHILPVIDDGSSNCSCSLEMLKESAKQGVTDIIFTPHYRKIYKPTIDEIKNEFEKIKDMVAKSNIDVNLYLGQEVFIERNYKQLLTSNKVLTMNDSKYVLIEFDYEKDMDMADIVYELKVMGYIPIVAHYERYSNADLETAVEIKSIGGLLQINAESIVGKVKKRYYKLIKQLFKNGLVDFVASDVHYDRLNLLSVAKRFVQRKFGKEVANKVFALNAEKIIKG